MDHKNEIIQLIRNINNAIGTKAAESALQDFVTGVLRKRMDKNEFSSMIVLLDEYLRKERKKNIGVMHRIKLDSVIEIVQNYKTLI